MVFGVRAALVVLLCALGVNGDGRINTADHCSAQFSRSAGPTMGVDYYPEQWPLHEMKADLQSIKQDLGADIIRVGEFMWSSIEPSDGLFNFTLLDTILEAAKSAGLCVMLGTPTATMPAWLYTAHPDVMSTGPDSPEGYVGATASFGGRRQNSFNSPVYQRYVSRLVSNLAKRYGNRTDVLSLFQVDNELGHEGSDLDFSVNALNAWREWLCTQYEGVDALNEAWGTRFWGADYSSFQQVPLPKWTMPGSSPRPNEAFRANMSPGMLLAYRRFRASSIANFANTQVGLLRAESSVKITTNSPGGVWGKAMDSNLFFSKMDFPAYDNYPVWGGSTSPIPPSMIGLYLDMVRGWGAYDQGVSGGGFMISEQVIGTQGHDIIGFTPRPQQAVAWSAQTLAHGASSLLFFRYRAAVYGQEEFCYGILDHTTPMASGRKWEEAKQVFELAHGDHSGLWMSGITARVALIYDPSNIFAWQAQPQSTAFDFATEAHRLYRPFWRAGVAIDVISANRIVDGSVDLSHYKIILLPAPMLVSDDTVKMLTNWTMSGGSLWVGFRSDLKHIATNQMKRSLSRLAELAGVSVAEFESLNAGLSVTVRGAGTNASATVWREALQIRNNSDTKALYEYEDDFFGALGYKAMTRRLLSTGGEVVYLGAGIEPAALEGAALTSLKFQAVECMQPLEPELEQLRRQDSNGKVWDIRINYGTTAITFLAGKQSIRIPPYGVSILAAGVF